MWFEGAVPKRLAVDDLTVMPNEDDSAGDLSVMNRSFDNRIDHAKPFIGGRRASRRSGGGSDY
jgi:hypothetical protein